MIKLKEIKDIDISSNDEVIYLCRLFEGSSRNKGECKFYGEECFRCDFVLKQPLDLLYVRKYYGELKRLLKENDNE